MNDAKIQEVTKHTHGKDQGVSDCRDFTIETTDGEKHLFRALNTQTRDRWIKELKIASKFHSNPKEIHSGDQINTSTSNLL